MNARHAELDARWRERWAGVRPVGHELRTTAHSTWVRFHSLPESKRYPDTEIEYAVLLERHRRVLEDLQATQRLRAQADVAIGKASGTTEAGSTEETVWVVTVAWSGSNDVVAREPDVAAAMPDAEYWQSLPYGDDPAYPVWMHLYLSVSRVGSPELTSLVRLVADDRAREVIVADRGLRWLYHPYDGGADVIAPSTAVRDELRDRYRAWLSQHPRGL